MSDGPWMRAVRDTAAEEPVTDPLAAIRGELECLWQDLGEAIRSTIRTRHNPDGAKWSVQADNIASRIIVLSRIAGATPWEKVQIPLVLDGTWHGLMNAAGIEHAQPDDDDLLRMAVWASGPEAGARM